MTSSLAAQLKRLEAPQTNLLFDSKKRVSILFDSKEAANKDRETIYDIGISGLEELVALNPVFLQFENTLFERSSKDLERSVESAKVNLLLNKTIKKFLLHLSPYFLLQPAHKCLEWLIRRFHLHEFNKDDFILLILPFHETRIFVRCLQTMKIKNESDRWYWLYPSQKAGVPLSKQAIFNRASCDPVFLKSVCDCTYEAVKELDVKAHTLQVKFAFYCTTVIGALEIIPEVNESLVSSILRTLLKGLSSNIIDFSAASFMIAAQLVSKIKVSKKLLTALTEKIAEVNHPRMQQDAVLLFAIIYQTQEENFNQVKHEVLLKVASNKWFPMVMGQVAQQGIKIIALYNSIMRSCLKTIQLKEEGWMVCKTLCENLSLEVVFESNDAEQVISSVLDSFILSDKKKINKMDSKKIISLDSDEENDIEMTESNIDVSTWYSEFLKMLERQYPEAFDRVIRYTMRGKGLISDSRKNALKTVLGFLLKVAHSSDDANVFENLYHHNAKFRKEAVKYLVINFDKMNISPESSELLKESIGERLSEENPNVVGEILKFDPETLTKLIGTEDLLDKLWNILIKYKNDEEWQPVIAKTIKLLCSSAIYANNDLNKIFLILLPFLLDGKNANNNYKQLIHDSEYGQSCKFVKLCEKKSAYDMLKGKMNLPEITSLIVTVNKIEEKNLNASKIFYSTLLLSYALPSKSSASLSRQVLSIMFRLRKLSSDIPDNNSIDLSEVQKPLHRNKIPIVMYIVCLENIIENTDFTDLFNGKILNFSEQTNSLSLILQIYEMLINKIMQNTTTVEIKAVYSKILKNLLNTLFPTVENKMEFLSNFYIENLNCLNPDTCSTFVKITPEFQLRSIRLMNSVLPQLGGSNDFNLEPLTLVKILLGFTTEISIIRESTNETIFILAKSKQLSSPAYKMFLDHLQNRSEELILDPTQLSLIVYTILSPDKSIRKTMKASDKKFSDNIITEFLYIIEDKITPINIKCKLLETLNLINNGEIFNKVCISGVEVLTECEQKIARKEFLMNPYEASILNSNILRLTLNEQIIKITIKYNNIWLIIEKSLKCHQCVINLSNGQTTSPAIQIMDSITNSLYTNLPIKYKLPFLCLVLDAATYSDNTDVITSAGKLFNRILLDGKTFVTILEDMLNVKIDTPGSKTTNKKRRQDNLVMPPELLLTNEWKRGVTLLEFIQNKKQLGNANILIPILFNLIKKCLVFEEQTPIEYSKQMIISCIHNCCVQLSPNGNPIDKIIPDHVFQTDLVVECIRASQNPQTHHHALLLLAYTASMVPDQVLQNITHIFTFMGSSVVRHDDAYSFQIISKIIETVIPTLIESEKRKSKTNSNETLLPVIKVFCDIVLDVPEHRRLPLYKKLLNTLGTKEYFWLFLAVLFETHVRNDEKEKRIKQVPLKNLIETEIFPKRISIALSIAMEFDPEDAIETCIRLIAYLSELPIDSPTETSKKMGISTTDNYIFDVYTHSNKQLRHFKYCIIQFISSLTSSPQFVNKIAALTDDETKNMKAFYKNIIIKILMYIPEVSKATEKNSDTTQLKYWKVMLHHCYDILDNTISLLSPDMLLVVVHGLMQHKLISVRKKVIELLNSKLQHKHDFFGETDKKMMMELLEPLTVIVESIIDEHKLPENSTVTEMNYIQQISLISIKLLSKILAQNYPNEFKKLLDLLTEIIKNRKEISRIVLATVILACAELCSNLKAFAISSLSKIIPGIIKLLQNIIAKGNIVNDPVLLSIVTAIHKIVEALPLFLSPYIVKIVTYMSQLWGIIQKNNSDPKVSVIVMKLTVTWQKIAMVVPPRVLIPSVDQSYENLIIDEDFAAIGPLMNLISESFVTISNQDVATFMPELSTFFLKCLQLRNDNSDKDSKEIDIVEGQIIKAFSILILKLSENAFRPLFHKIYDWAIRDGDFKERTITFYRLSNIIAASLKSLFGLFAGIFIQNAATLLDKCNTAKCNEENALYFPDSEDKCSFLLVNIIKTLSIVCMHDSQNFVNAQRFDIIMQPIVDQLENEYVINNEEIKSLVTPCLAHLAAAVADDTLWKQMNYQILMKTRNNNPNIRLFALTTFVEIAKKLGEDFLPLLPETIPFLAELLEDENNEVERSCQKAVQDLEKVLGEPLQKYF